MSPDQRLIQTLNTYDDRFVNIDGANGTLTLKHYRLRKPTRKVHIPSLRYIRPANEVVKRIGIRPQGISLSGVLWARDGQRGTAIKGPGRGYERSFVIKVQGERLRSGFSVEDPDMFLAVLERVYPGILEMFMGEAVDEETPLETDRDFSHRRSWYRTR